MYNTGTRCYVMMSEEEFQKFQRLYCDKRTEESRNRRLVYDHLRYGLIGVWVWW